MLSLAEMLLNYSKMTYFHPAMTGSLFGYMVGDAAGVPFDGKTREEMRKHPMKKGELIGYKCHNTPPGTWSGTSGLMLATMKSVMDQQNSLDADDLMKKYTDWYDNAKYTAFGKQLICDPAVESAIHAYKEGTRAHLCGMNCNAPDSCGALIRTLPLAFLNGSEDRTYAQIVSVAGLTNPADTNVLCCCIYAAIVRQILMGEMSKKWAIEEGIKSVGDRYSLAPLESTINSLRNPPRDNEERMTDSSAINTLQAALSSFLYTHNYEECILHAVNLGGNTSEVTALAGGLAGARYRVQGIPKNWLNALVDKDRVDKLVIKYTDYFYED